MTKADVLTGFGIIKVCNGYKTTEGDTDHFPYDVNTITEPVYREFPAWSMDISRCNSADDFPKEMTDYINYLEGELKIPITIVSVGPDRNQTIEL